MHAHTCGRRLLRPHEWGRHEGNEEHSSKGSHDDGGLTKAEMTPLQMMATAGNLTHNAQCC